MSAHECENARNHVAVSGLANTLHPVLFLLNWKTITFMSVCLVNLPLSFFAFTTFKCSCNQRGRNLLCGVDDEDFHSAHPTGWAESISGNGVCMYVCMFVRHHFKDDE